MGLFSQDTYDWKLPVKPHDNFQRTPMLESFGAMLVGTG